MTERAAPPRGSPGRDPECWFCDDEQRLDPPPTGWLLDDGLWRVGHAPASYSIAGTLIVESRRHVIDQTAMNVAESSTLVPLMAASISALTDATGCDRVYQWATMDGYAHFHLWLVPWFATADTRGPRYLVRSVVEAGGCTQREADEAAEAIRASLTAATGPEAPTAERPRAAPGP